MHYLNLNLDQCQWVHVVLGNMQGRPQGNSKAPVELFILSLNPPSYHSQAGPTEL